MSGLTGYLTQDGTDLSMVFMPLSSSVISLSANNTFSGTNTFNGVVSLAKPTTLLTGSNPTTILSQIGGTAIYSATQQTLQAGTSLTVCRNLYSTASLVPGTYVLMGFIVFSSYTVSALTGFGMAFNDVTATYNTTVGSPYRVSMSCGTIGGSGTTVSTGTGFVNLQTSMTINLTSATIIYLNYTMVSTGTFTTNGQINVTRIG